MTKADRLPIFQWELEAAGSDNSSFRILTTFLGSGLGIKRYWNVSSKTDEDGNTRLVTEFHSGEPASPSTVWTISNYNDSDTADFKQ